MDWNDSRISFIEVTPIWSGSLPVQAVNDALLNAGVPKGLLPKAPTRIQAMRRAFERMAKRGDIVDILPKSAGVSLTLKNADLLDVEQAVKKGEVSTHAHETVLTGKINVVNVNGTDVIDLTFSPNDHPLIPLIKELYNGCQDEYYCPEDLSVWMSQTVLKALGAIPKRSRGGIYYVSASRKKLLLDVTSALQSVSTTQAYRTDPTNNRSIERVVIGGKLCLEPRYSDDQAAVEILIDGVIRNTDTMLDDIQADMGKDLGTRALTTKKETLTRLEKEISNWEKLTASSLDLLRNRLVEVTNLTAAAIMKCEYEADQKDLKK